MVFTIDKTQVIEGEIVEVSWSCPEAESTKLSINNGFKSITSDVEKEGGKKFKLNRSNGKTLISLEAVVDGKNVKKSYSVTVKPDKEKLRREIKAKKEQEKQQRKLKRDRKIEEWKRKANWQEGNKQYDSYENLDHHPFRDKLSNLRSRFKFFWQSQSPQKKQAYIIILFICIIMIIASFYPAIIYFGLCTIAFYLLWTISRRN